MRLASQVAHGDADGAACLLTGFTFRSAFSLAFAAGEAGGWTQLGRQAVLAVVGIAWTFVMTWIILWVTDHTVGCG